MHKINNFSGLSGCAVELYEFSNQYMIKKTSASVDYNHRLVSQILKQKKFNSSQFLKPKVIEDGADENGKYYVLMEYICGLNFSDYIDASAINQSEKILGLILDKILNDFHGKVAIDPMPISLKIRSLQNAIVGFDDIFIYLSKNIPEELPLKISHGDLTFENIIISDDENIYLIDFLDSFIETPYVDLAKLRQEFDLRWSIRNNKVSNNQIIKYEYLQSIYFNFIQNSKIDIKILNFFTVLNLLRIIPYAELNDKEMLIRELNIWKTKLQ